MSTTTELKRDLLDSDGENRAVRAFLILYGSTNSPTIEGMRDHMEFSGFGGCWPAWAASKYGFLTKGGAQDWLRHLFALEGRSAAHGEQSNHIEDVHTMVSAEQSEREAFGKWASAAGYDVAYTYDTERSRHIWLNQMTADIWNAWQARAALSARQAPGGCVIVPKEPTPEMINSVMYWFGNINTARYATEVYNAFIAAAPSTAQKDGVKE